MKVICVNNGPLLTSSGVVRDAPELQEGKTYTVVYEKPIGYVLKEVSPIQNDPYWYLSCFNKYRFIPLSTIDETEFERNYNKQLI